MKTIFARLAGLPLALWNLFAPAIRYAATEGLTNLAPVALDVVAKLAMTNKTGAEKRAEAIAVLTDYARTSGSKASESIIRFSIEAALASLKQGGLK